MAKSLLRIEARKLREKGISVKQIAIQLGVAKSTTSLWVRDIILSVNQLEILKQRSITGGELGRLKASLMQKQRRLDLVEQYKVEGTKSIPNLSDRELLLIGLALYSGEGAKTVRRVEFCNSDPEVIKFAIRWLQRCFNVDISELVGYIKIDGSHSQRSEKIINYWSEVTGLTSEQFRKIHFKKMLNKKVYANYEDHYGTLSIRVSKSANLCYRILGLIHGMYQAA